MKITESILALKAALKGDVGDLDAWLEVNNEQEVRLAIQYLLKEQDRDTRHACAEAVVALPTECEGLCVNVNKAHSARMNAQAI